MNAAEARKRRGGTMLVERASANPQRAARIEQLVKAAEIERLVEAVMRREDVSGAELARRMHVAPPQISRDLNGGLRNATLSRLAGIAHALGYELITALIPKRETPERRTFFEAYEALMPDMTPSRPRKKIARRSADVSVSDRNRKPRPIRPKEQLA